MKCEDAADLIIDRLMDSLDTERERALLQHLETCDACAAESRSLTAVWEDLERLPAPALRPADPARVAMEIGRGLGASAGAPPASWRRGGIRLAASIALLLLGGWGGYALRGPAPVPVTGPSEGSTFLLLARGEEPDSRVEPERAFEEYRAWASSLAERGLVVGGAKLTDEPGRWVSGSSDGDPRTRSDVQGYFLIRAPDYEGAIELAMGSPHIRYGGVFEIRQLDQGN